VLFLLALAGCQPTCEQVCDKLVACEEAGTERMSSAECVEQCGDQKRLYATWTDTQLRDAFDAELDCLDASSCAAIFEDGVCYDDEVWSF
jgi:hypothetical protein